MRNKYMLVGAVVGIVVGVLLSSAVFVWAGNVDSPAAPGATNSFTLNDIYNRLDSGAAGAQSTFTEPAAGPGTGTMHTLNETMAKAPARDDANGALTGEVENGKTFWGLNVAGGEWGLQTGTADCDGGAGVPKTGQTTSYRTGDDGDLERGVAWPVPRFTDNTDGTVTDNLTGLIWLKNANCWGSKGWNTAIDDCNALASGSCGLTDGSVAGDWRLPNWNELRSLIDASRYNPALPSGHPFTGVQLRYYWSSTTAAASTGYAWVVGLGDGDVYFDGKGSSAYVWPVRGGQ
jgi:hypothetical protein